MVGLTVSRSGRGVVSSRRLGVGLAALLVLGIVGMHVFTQHCSPPADEPGVAVTASVVSGTSTHAHAVTNESRGFTPSAAERGEDQRTDAMVALCAAMLLAAGAAIFLLLGFRRGWPRGWLIRRAMSSLARPMSVPLGTGPPYVVAFAVIRC